MKKIAICLVVLIAVFFCGCSCNGENSLEFENYWGGTTVGYTETTTYSVNYTDNYYADQKSFVKDKSLSNLAVDISGTYINTVKVLPKSSSELPQELDNSEVYKCDTNSIICIYSELSLTANYTFNGEKQTSTDTVKNCVYTCFFDYSLAPIYSVSEYDYSVVGITNALRLNKVKGKNTVLYNNTKYLTNQTLFNDDGSVSSSTDKEVKYTVRTVIDNNQFLFALRNVKIESGKSTTLPVVHLTHNKAQTLSVTYFTNTEKTVNVNGSDAVTNVKGYSYRISSLETSGYDQIVYLQNSNLLDYKNKSLMVTYVEPISEYSGFKMLGALVYTLNTVNIVD